MHNTEVYIWNSAYELPCVQCMSAFSEQVNDFFTSRQHRYTADVVYYIYNYDYKDVVA